LREKKGDTEPAPIIILMVFIEEGSPTVSSSQCPKWSRGERKALALYSKTVTKKKERKLTPSQVCIGREKGGKKGTALRRLCRSLERMKEGEESAYLELSGGKGARDYIQLTIYRKKRGGKKDSYFILPARAGGKQKEGEEGASLFLGGSRTLSTLSRKGSKRWLNLFLDPKRG